MAGTVPASSGLFLNKAAQPHVLEDGSGIVFTKVLDGTLLRPMAVVDVDGAMSGI